LTIDSRTVDVKPSGRDQSHWFVRVQEVALVCETLHSGPDRLTISSGWNPYIAGHRLRMDGRNPAYRAVGDGGGRPFVRFR
jgi:hypothetical protein